MAGLPGGHTVTYKQTGAFSGALLLEPELKGVSFTLGLNQAGPFRGGLAVEDPVVQSSDWLDATEVNKTCTWVDIDGQLAYGGITNDRNYDLAKGAVELSASEHYSYLAQRLQAKDYAGQWAQTPAAALTIAQTVLTDALAVIDSVPITILTQGSTPSQFYVPFSAPITQRLSVDMIVREFTQMGYPVGIDFAHDPIYVAGKPTAQITLSYPQRGRTPPASPLEMDLSYALQFTYEEQGQSQANGIVEMLSGSGGVSGEAFAEAPLAQGWPLLEAVGSHSGMSSIPAPDAVVEAYLTGDLALRAYPMVVATVTFPLFDDSGAGGYPSWGQWQIGDDVLLVSSPAAGNGPPANPRFPTGLQFYFRIIQAEITIADEGISTVKFTLNLPPSNIPTLPPGV
jgi:hypothetical protein